MKTKLSLLAPVPLIFALESQVFDHLLPRPLPSGEFNWRLMRGGNECARHDAEVRREGTVVIEMTKQKAPHREVQGFGNWLPGPDSNRRPID